MRMGALFMVINAVPAWCVDLALAVLRVTTRLLLAPRPWCSLQCTTTSAARTFRQHWRRCTCSSRRGRRARSSSSSRVGLARALRQCDREPRSGLPVRSRACSICAQPEDTTAAHPLQIKAGVIETAEVRTRAFRAPCHELTHGAYSYPLSCTSRSFSSI
jgi:hypothetical protein